MSLDRDRAILGGWRCTRHRQRCPIWVSSIIGNHHCRAGRSNMNVAEAEKNFATLVNKVYVEGVSVDLERDDKVIARLTPAVPRSRLTLGELNAFLRSLPSLGDDAEDLAKDLGSIRAEFPAEANPWD